MTGHLFPCLPREINKQSRRHQSDSSAAVAMEAAGDCLRINQTNEVVYGRLSVNDSYESLIGATNARSIFFCPTSKILYPAN